MRTSFLYWVFKNIIRSPIRTIIVVVATSISIASFTFSIGVLNGLNREFENFVRETGSLDVVTLTPNPSSDRFIVDGPPTLDDVRWIRANIQDVFVGPQLVWWQFEIRNSDFSTRQILCGGDSQTMQALRHDVIEGRPLCDLDVANEHRVIVLGQKALRNLFPNTKHVLGEKVRIGSFDFEVVGILRTYSYFDGTDPKDMPYKNGYNFIPLSTAKNLFYGGGGSLNYIQVRSNVELPVASLIKKIATLMTLKGRSTGSLHISSSASQAEQWMRTKRSMQIGLGLLSLSCLMISAVCAVSAQMASVSERQLEYGIRRAMGASRLDIWRLVVSEMLALYFVGGICGILLSVISFPIIEVALPDDMPGSPTMVWWTVPLSLVVSLIAGYLAGALPARTAANQDPLEALKCI
jgi:putative ABC transport system permease protein